GRVRSGRVVGDVDRPRVVLVLLVQLHPERELRCCHGPGCPGVLEVRLGTSLTRCRLAVRSHSFSPISGYFWPTELISLRILSRVSLGLPRWSRGRCRYSSVSRARAAYQS